MPGSQVSASRPKSSAISAASTSASSTSSPTAFSAPEPCATPSTKRSPRFFLPTRSTSSPSSSGVGCSAGASRKGRAAMKTASRWYSKRVGQEINLVRWGHWGQPVLVFPTAGGDAEEIERMQLVAALFGLIEVGRIKVYSCDSLAGRALAAGWGSVEYRCALLDRFEQLVAEE